MAMVGALSWVTVIWSMIAAGCLTLGAVIPGVVQEPHGVGTSALCRDRSLDDGLRDL